MSQQGYHMHGESSRGHTYRHQESRSRHQHLPDNSSWEARAAFEDGEEPLSVQDDVGQVEYRGFIDRQKQLLPSAAREFVIPSQMDGEDLSQYLKCLNDVHKPSKIRDGLYIANYETACFYLSGGGNHKKQYPKIGHILSLINFPAKDESMYDALQPEDPEEFPDGTRLLLKIEDSTLVNPMALFPIIITFLVKAINDGGTDKGKGRGVLVHCRKGMSRSVAAVMAYLAWAENKKVIDIWRQVVSFRIVAWPNAEFYTQLVMWAMWNHKLTGDDGKPLMKYDEYVIKKGLSTPWIDGGFPDLVAHLGLTPPKPWPMKYVQN